jgi:hypothetical protein
MLLNGRLSNDTGSARSDIPNDVMLEFWLVEILLKYFYCLLHTKDPYHLTVMCLPNHL